ncbi:hypothetical protein CLG94_09375 [Candidatus Methylomirabilis limnetica]|uniref:Vitamin K epoxide reductase domain-containing protein n=2 Tax=Candidatus Methylomirabilis limnetica TaxID=2033718 RepID=A0A2T4TWI7_9BACT|nr:hypothetical protein CLG94_09375 [Candidatus Methylomirabilis limnetica]
MHDGAPMSQSKSTEAVAGRRARRWWLMLPVLALLGMADSGYLLWLHRTTTSAFCPTAGCDVVNQGEYSEIRGVPLAAFGIAAYLALLALSVMAVALDSRRVLGVMLAIAGIGVAVSAWLVYLQVAVIGSICFWCVLSAFTMLSILAMSLSAFLVKRDPQRSELASPPRVTQVPSGALPQSFRFPLMALGMIALLAAMLGGLFRLGWDWSSVPSTLPPVHGPLMISGFLGTLIGLERTVAMGRWWPSIGPLCTGIGALLLIAGVPGVAGPILMTLGSLILVITFVQLIRGQPALFTVTMGLGALAWLVGNTLWLVGWPIFRVVSWWAAFLILTIAGERLELSRFLPLARRHRLSFLAAIGFFVAGLLLAVVAFDGGSRMSGLGLIAMSIWLLRHDMARHSVQKTGLHRFVALSLLVGYVWLAVAGLLMLSLGGVATGVHHAAALHVHEHGVQDGYDAALHAMFVGFAFSMIIGHAPIIFPSVLGISLPFRPAFYSHLVLLHLSLVLRVVGDLAAWWPGRLGGGLLNVVAVLLFLGNMALSGTMGRQSVSLGDAGNYSGR